MNCSEELNWHLSIGVKVDEWFNYHTILYATFDGPLTFLGNRHFHGDWFVFWLLLPLSKRQSKFQTDSFMHSSQRA